MELRKSNSENEAQYIWRLSLAKDSGVLDMSWDQLADTINAELGYDNTSSVYRKQFQSAKKFLDAGVFDKHDNNQYLEELQNLKRSIKSERQKLYATKVEYTRQVRQLSRQELFYQTIADEIKAIDPPVTDYVLGASDDDSDKEYVLTLSDIHAGAKFETDTNVYSLDECAARFGVLIDEMTNYIQANGLHILKVVCLGDTIQGILRVSDLQLNDSSVVEATVYVSKCIAELLNTLSEFCCIEYYHVPTANHTQVRPLGTKASEISSEDIEYIIGHYIQDVLVNNERVNVHLNFGKEYIEIPIFDELAIAMHGHQLKDVGDALRTLSFKNQKFYTVAFLGHYHSASRRVVMENGIKDYEVIVCPSFVGTDPYADSIFKGARPACGVYVFDKRNGHVRSERIALT